MSGNPSPYPPSVNNLCIYLVAIGGTGMAPLACLLKQAGYRVTGSDGPIYPPMSTLLEEAGVETITGYDPANLERVDPDLVVIGNAVPRDQVEAAAVEASGRERISMPQALARFFLADRRPLVVAGTHGKTTTTSLAAWVWSDLGHDPGYLIGGVPLNLNRSFALGTGERFIIEGDEYNAAYFDRGPKFLHYRPQALILTSVEWDHADLYPDHDSLLDAYRRLVAIVPQDGTILACGTAPGMAEVLDAASARVLTYGIAGGGDLDLAADDLTSGAWGQRFNVYMPGDEPVSVQLAITGLHNVENALGVYGAARLESFSPQEIAGSLGRFRGVQRRMEVIGEAGGVTVIDDFGHHPTAVETTLKGARPAYPGRRIVALFEPRSLTAGRAMFHEPYLDAFAHADVALFAPIFHAKRLSDEERLDLQRLTEDLRDRGIEAALADSNDRLLELALERVRPGDVVIAMSSGSFEDVPRRLVEGLVDSG